jgi:hypothetical protein
MRIYIDLRSWWIGYQLSDTHHRVCVLPAVVIEWPRRLKRHRRT